MILLIGVILIDIAYDGDININNDIHGDIHSDITIDNYDVNSDIDITNDNDFDSFKIDKNFDFTTHKKNVKKSNTIVHI